MGTGRWRSAYARVGMRMGFHLVEGGSNENSGRRRRPRFGRPSHVLAEGPRLRCAARLRWRPGNRTLARWEARYGHPRCRDAQGGWLRGLPQDVWRVERAGALPDVP